MSQKTPSSELTPAEVQAIDRLTRALSFERESNKSFVSLSAHKKSKVLIGLRQVLRSIQSGKASLVVVPAKAPEETFYVVSELAKVNGIPLWTPPVSSYGLGRRLFKSGPCQAVAFTHSPSGNSLDAIGSIRDFILSSILASCTEQNSRELGQEPKTKRIKLAV